MIECFPLAVKMIIEFVPLLERGDIWNGLLCMVGIGIQQIGDISTFFGHYLPRRISGLRARRQTAAKPLNEIRRSPMLIDDLPDSLRVENAEVELLDIFGKLTFQRN